MSLGNCWVGFAKNFFDENAPYRKQPKKDRGNNAAFRRTDRCHWYSTGDGPWNQRGNDNRGVFQRSGHFDAG